jgi:hypothetical protein
MPAALHRAQSGVVEYHWLRDLSRDLRGIDEKICRARPVEDTLTPEEEKRPRRSRSKFFSLARLVATLLELMFAERRPTGRTDPEAIEMAFRAALHRAGAWALGRWLRFGEPDQQLRSVPCPCSRRGALIANCPQTPF